MSLLSNILSGAGGATVGEFRTSDAQNPTELGDAGKIRVHFGDGGITTDQAVSVDSDGLVHQLIGRVYVMSLHLSFGRAGPAGVSRLMGRGMVALDGIVENAIQSGPTLSLEVDTANQIWEERINFRTSFPGGAIFWFEIARDEVGTDAGGLITNQPSGTLSGWNIAETASLVIRTT